MGRLAKEDLIELLWQHPYQLKGEWRRWQTHQWNDGVEESHNNGTAKLIRSSTRCNSRSTTGVHHWKAATIPGGRGSEREGEQLGNNRSTWRRWELGRFYNRGNKAKEKLGQTTPDEAHNEVKLLKSNKGSGPDGIPPGILKMLPAQWMMVFTSVFNNIFLSGIYPNTESQVKLVTVFKEGDKRNVRNCRGIGVINCMVKLYDMVLSSMLNHAGSRQCSGEKGLPGTYCFFAPTVWPS